MKSLTDLVEYIGPDILDNILPHVAACDDERFPEDNLPRASCSFVPRLFKEFGDTLSSSSSCLSSSSDIRSSSNGSSVVKGLVW